MDHLGLSFLLLTCFWTPTFSDNADSFAHAQEMFEQRLRMHSRHHWNNLSLKRIHKARRRNATCMDGSDARYYLSRQWESNNWVIHLQGGGSCITYDECRSRSEGPLGSSLPLDAHITGEWTLSNDPKINPTFHKWNKVLIPYCSGDVFVGRMLKKNHPYRLPMLGHYIFSAVIEDLVRLYKINKKKTKILFGGTSAGGVGVLANADYLQEMTKPAKVRAYNDGGWFTLFRSFGEKHNTNLPQFFHTLATLFEKHWDGFADKTCQKHMPKSAACLYGELAIQYVKTPMFVMTSMWDLYQLNQMVPRTSPVIHLPPKLNQETKYLESFANNSYRSITGLLRKPKNGVFSPACYSHIFFTNCIGGIICGAPKKTVYSSGGQTAYGALTDWYLTDGAEGSYIDDIIESPTCNPSCCTQHCHKCKSLNDILHGTKNGHTNLVYRHRKRKKETDTKNEVERNHDNQNNYQRFVYYSKSYTLNPHPSVMYALMSMVSQIWLQLRV
ncbi:uncharacterized protein [Clytia hemisphaerica]|uniref:Uncharacterized protein n=1 Tax=Clytia hemisphaerica TaxID=252671 RepID=A0A7M5V693_9CNID